ncbi:MAG: 4-hydroxy-tetrahydrodipicolinate reductase [bacterium]
MTGVIITGAAGRMGRAMIRCSSDIKGLRIVGAVERPGDPAIGRDAGTVAGMEPSGVTVFDNLGAIPPADVLIDFSVHTAAAANVALAVRRHMAVVLGTTGLTESEGKLVRKAAKHTPVVWAPNMSLGVNLLFALVNRAAATLGLNYDVEITEVHHKHKKDAPSGTALKLAEEVAAGRKQKLDNVAVYGRRGQTGERPAGQIAIHAIRMGDVVGDHTVCLATEGERLELTHRATSRDALALGALRAAMWVKGKKPGLYSMRDVLGL